MSSFTDYQAVQQYLKTKLAPITDGVVLGNLNRDRSISKYQGKVGYIAFAGYPPQTDSQGLRSAYTVHVYCEVGIICTSLNADERGDYQAEAALDLLDLMETLRTTDTNLGGTCEAFRIAQIASDGSAIVKLEITL